MSLNDELKALRDRWRDMPPLLPGHHWDRYLPLRMADELEAILSRHGWLPMDTAPKNGMIHLAVEAGGDRRVFVAESTFDGPDERAWMITVGWTGWTKLHSEWKTIGWKPMPDPPEAAEQKP